VRLAGLVGGATGWMGFRAAFVAFFLMFLLGSIGGILQILVTKSSRRAHIGFAPYMAAGCLIVVIFTIPLMRFLHPVLHGPGS
jgi:prepilin signal peptidase PulO-like enzyme (type II secretory pathway)